MRDRNCPRGQYLVTSGSVSIRSVPVVFVRRTFPTPSTRNSSSEYGQLLTVLSRASTAPRPEYQMKVESEDTPLACENRFTRVKCPCASREKPWLANAPKGVETRRRLSSRLSASYVRCSRML